MGKEEKEKRGKREKKKEIYLGSLGTYYWRSATLTKFKFNSGATTVMGAIPSIASRRWIITLSDTISLI